MTNWYIEKGPESDVVISSRIRLARNFKAYPFPGRMTGEQGEKIITTVKDAITKNRSDLKKTVEFFHMQSLSPTDRQAMVEKHLISPDLASSQRNSGVILSKDEKVSIMINEEDHLRIQCLFPGMQIDSAWKACDTIDSMLEQKIEYAFSDKLGYLTCCPTNLGTGIRASAMLHLPALVMTGYIKGVLEVSGKLGMAVRGMYGENSEASGNMFQISNQVTLGLSEEEIVTNITNIVFQIIEQERLVRKELFNHNTAVFEDRIFRSLGVLSHARITTTEESLKLLSDVRLGVDMGIIKDIPVETLNEIMILIQPANLQKAVGKPLEAVERDIRRAELIRSKLGMK